MRSQTVNNFLSRKFWLTILSNWLVWHAVDNRMITGTEWLIFLGGSLFLYFYAQGRIDIHRIKASVGKDGISFSNNDAAASPGVKVENN